LYRDFVLTADFDYYWKAIGLDEEELFNLQNKLLDNPRIGAVISGTGGCRKIRYALTNGGKRGGARIIYLDVPKFATIYLLLVYPKSLKDNLTQQEKNSVRAIAMELKEGV
jgi:hypothetical protein